MIQPSIHREERGCCREKSKTAVGPKPDMHVMDFPLSPFASRSTRPRNAFNSPENVLDVPCLRPRVHHD